MVCTWGEVRVSLYSSPVRIASLVLIQLVVRSMLCVADAISVLNVGALKKQRSMPVIQCEP